jgi:hypothetical protein
VRASRANNAERAFKTSRLSANWELRVFLSSSIPLVARNASESPLEEVTVWDAMRSAAIRMPKRLGSAKELCGHQALLR